MEKASPAGSPASAALTETQVRHVAKLARLKLGDQDITRYAGQLSSILKYVAQLSEVPVDGISPMAHPLPLHNVLREDAVTSSLPVEAVLANAPSRDGSFFTVPKVLDASMGGG